MADNKVFRLLGGVKEFLFDLHARLVLIQGVLTTPNHPSWGHLEVTVLGTSFLGPPGLGLETVFGEVLGTLFGYFRTGY